jgi:hypothetical protein
MSDNHGWRRRQTDTAFRKLSNIEPIRWFKAACNRTVRGLTQPRGRALRSFRSTRATLASGEGRFPLEARLESRTRGLALGSRLLLTTAPWAQVPSCLRSLSCAHCQAAFSWSLRQIGGNQVDGQRPYRWYSLTYRAGLRDAYEFL